MAITSLDAGSTIELGAGIIYFDPWDANDFRTGEIDLGEPDDVSLTIEQGDSTERRTRRVVARPTIFSTTTQGAKSIGITSLSVTAEILRLFISGEKTTVTQAAVGVTNEVIWSRGLEAEDYFQLGQSASNPVGILGGTSVTIASFDSAIAAWQATTGYTVGEQAEKVSDDGTVWTAIVAGTSGGSEPTWPTTGIGDTVVSGTVTFMRTASAQETFTLDTDYQLEAGADGGLRIKWISPDTFPWALYANYTPAASTRTRVQTGDDSSIFGTLRFVAAATSPVYCKHLVCHKVELIPEGDLGLITDETTPKQVGFTAKVISVSGIPDIMIDGVPA